MHEHHHGPAATPRRALLWVLVANAAFLVIEFVGALVFDSVALLADTVHMVSDVGALLVALGAAALAARPATERHTYGLGRAEVLAAQFNALALLAASAWLVFEAVDRIDAPRNVRGGGVMVVAAVGLALNVGSAYVLARSGRNNLNVRGVFWHMVGDALGSVAALVAGAAAFFFAADWVDPVASLAVTVLVVIGALRVLRDSTRVLLDASPAGVDVREVVAVIESVPGISSAHHVHVWTIGTGSPALSVHVVVGESVSSHEAQAQANEVRHRLEHQFGIEHATIEVECHECVDPAPH